MSEIRNKKWSDDKFYQVREEVLATWPTGKDVANIEEGIEYQRTIPHERVFTTALNQAKAEGRTLVQPRAGVALIDKQIELLNFLTKEGEADLLPSTIDSTRVRTATRKPKSGRRVDQDRQVHAQRLPA